MTMSIFVAIGNYITYTVIFSVKISLAQYAHSCVGDLHPPAPIWTIWDTLSTEMNP